MSKLKAFLQPPITGKTKEVVVSDRFVDENGTIQPFVIQAISQEKNAELSENSKNEKIVVASLCLCWIMDSTQKGSCWNV